SSDLSLITPEERAHVEHRLVVELRQPRRAEMPRQVVQQLPGNPRLLQGVVVGDDVTGKRLGKAPGLPAMLVVLVVLEDAAKVVNHAMPLACNADRPDRWNTLSPHTGSWCTPAKSSSVSVPSR